jgi:dihydrofolate synthase/folylpolyglutamate synthase
MRALCAVLGDPQDAFPVVHVTGTNGKGSTVRMVSSLLTAHGLSVGTYTSPHLERLNERMAWNGVPVSDDDLAAVLLDMAVYEEHLGQQLTHFEVLTASALRWFADVAVDVAVLEVGLGGRWDSTNVASASVAVVTNVGLDHVEVLGPTIADIAGEKAGIIKPGSTVVLGETSASLEPVFLREKAAAFWRRDVDFACLRNVVAVGGRVLDLQTPAGIRDEVFVPLYGPHQGDNAACAMAAAEAFFGHQIDATVVREAFGSVEVPGRFEIVRRHPLVVLDGAHNPDGARALAATLEDDFNARAPDVMVVGFTQGRDPAEMLGLLGARRIVAAAPPHPRALPPADVAAVARELGIEASYAPTVPAAIAQAMEAVSDEGFVLVTGSLYLVGSARTVLVGDR